MAHDKAKELKILRECAALLGEYTNRLQVIERKSPRVRSETVEKLEGGLVDGADFLNDLASLIERDFFGSAISH